MLRSGGAHLPTLPSISMLATAAAGRRSDPSPAASASPARHATPAVWPFSASGGVAGWKVPVLPCRRASWLCSWLAHRAAARSLPQRRRSGTGPAPAGPEPHCACSSAGVQLSALQMTAHMGAAGAEWLSGMKGHVPSCDGLPRKEKSVAGEAWAYLGSPAAAWIESWLPGCGGGTACTHQRQCALPARV